LLFTVVTLIGKTTTILSLLKRLPEGYTTCLLKNEFGDIAGKVKVIVRESTAPKELTLNFWAVYS
jgi:G3E family GTPase